MNVLYAHVAWTLSSFQTKNRSQLQLHQERLYWIGLCSVLRPRQHSIGYMGDGFYRSKDPTNSTEGKSAEEKLDNVNSKVHICIYNNNNKSPSQH